VSTSINDALAQPFQQYLSFFLNNRPFFFLISGGTSNPVSNSLEGSERQDEVIEKSPESERGQVSLGF